MIQAAPPVPVQTVPVESSALLSPRTVKGSGSGSEKGSVQNMKKGSVAGSGSGSPLPDLENIRWEIHKKGGFEAWHCPPGAAHRKEKTYLGYIGKRQLAAWSGLTPDDLFREAGRWIEDRRKGKGI